MRKYKPVWSEEVDLDNPDTYSHLPNTYSELRNLMFRHIGYTLVYMDYFPNRKGFFPKRKRKDEFIKKSEFIADAKDGDTLIEINNVAYNQRLRVYALIKNFAENEDKHTQDENLMWLKEQVFLFEDEIENMC